MATRPERNRRSQGARFSSLQPPSAHGIEADELARAQATAIAGRVRVRMLCGYGVIACMAVAALGQVPLWMVLGWTALAVGLTTGFAVTRKLRMRVGRPEIESLLRDELTMRIASSLLVALLAFTMRDAAPSAQFALVAAWTLALLTPQFCLSPAPRVMLAAIAVIAVTQVVLALFFGFWIVAVAAASGGVIVAYAGLIDSRDFLSQLRQTSALSEKQEVVSLLLREFEDSGADWLWQIDASRCLTHVSPRFAHALGAQPEDLEGRSVLEVLAGDSWEAGTFASGLRELAEKLKLRESFADLVLPIKIKGESRWWELSASPRLDEGGNFLGFRGVGSDVTAARASAEKIAKLARYDTLTGLPNRLMINEALAGALESAVRHHNRPGFMMIDLDRFKAVNDTLGHPVGDRLLVRVAERLRQLMQHGEIAGRLGGDEFAVVMNDSSDHARVQALSEAIISTLSRPYEVDQNSLYIGASVGTAVSPRDGRSAEMLIRSADLALYKSKEAGGGTAHAYQPSLHVDADQRRNIEIAMRKALERGEFHLVYQPVVSAMDPIIEGFETLLRWTNPTLGAVSPVRFIPIAEEARLIGPIGEWVLRTACEQAVQWPKQVRVAVNVSTDQLNDPNFVQIVVSALSHSGLEPSRLELEVTESLFLKDGGSAVQMLDRLLGLGIRLALDDFGTGYSSLGYLQKAHFSTIKVDRSFVQGAAAGKPESVAIIRAVVAMAEALGMSTTAEGVETESELEMIQRFGCSKVQGYLYGRPMPAEDTFDLLATADRRRQA